MKLDNLLILGAVSAIVTTASAASAVPTTLCFGLGLALFSIKNVLCEPSRHHFNTLILFKGNECVGTGRSTSVYLNRLPGKEHGLRWLPHGWSYNSSAQDPRNRDNLILCSMANYKGTCIKTTESCATFQTGSFFWTDDKSGMRGKVDVSNLR